MRWMATACATLALQWACRDGTAPPMGRLVPSPSPPSTPAEPCPGGLLCEAHATVFGVRVPRDCRPTHTGGLIRICVLDATAPDTWARAVEFVQSRYPGATVRKGVLLASPAAPIPGAHPPLLRMRDLGGSVEVAVIAGDADAPTPSALR